MIVSPEGLKERNLCVRLVDTHFSEWNDGDPFDKYDQRDRPFSALFFVLSDLEVAFTEYGESKEDEKTLTLRQGDILFIPSGIRYRERFRCKPGARPVTCTVNFDLFDLSGEQVLLNGRALLLRPGISPFLSGELTNLHKYAHRPGVDNLRIQSLFFSVLCEVTRKPAPPKNTETIAAGVRALENDWNKNRKAEYYARECGMSLTDFFRAFRAYTGMTPVQYRNSIRINTAKSEMRNTDLSVKEIARKVGFDDEFYFSRLFRKMTGVAPGEYKKKT